MTEIDQPLESGLNEGILSVVVWPTHLGAVTGHPGGGPRPMYESDDPYYERGQIEWLLEDGQIVGRAQLHVPAGIYEYLVFCHGPTGMDKMIGCSKFEHPLVFEKAGVMDVYPINYQG